MTILTWMELVINTSKDLILEGKKEIPSWHHLYGKKCWKCGSYIRRLILYDGRILLYRIYRYYSPEEKKTYSLLPFFIQRYERHINTVIEAVLESHLIDDFNKKDNEFSKKEVPSEWTERRWIKKFKTRLSELENNFEEFLSKYYPEYLPASKSTVSMGQQIQQLFEKAKIMVNNEINKIYPYGELSFCLLGQAIQNPTADFLGK
jgi:hypothetical protein